MGRTYVCFDADSDINYYRLMQAWDANPRFSFNFTNAHDLARLPRALDEDYIKSQLRIRLRGTTEFLLLVGENTRFLYRFVRWEIEEAIKLKLPIIVVNLNGKRSIDEDRCPPILRGQLAIHISFNQKIIQFAIKNWPSEFHSNRINGISSPFYYSNSTYYELGI